MTDYVELHAHSYFSLLDGTASPEALVDQAALLGMDALALTDHDALYGAPRFAEAAAAHGIRPIFGAEMTVDDHHLTLLVENETGWANLCQLITLARANAPKGKARLPFDALTGHTAGLIALSGCRQGAVASALFQEKGAAAIDARRYLAVFGRDHYFIELQHHLLPLDGAVASALVDIADRIGVEVVATNNVHYSDRVGQRLQDVLVCIRYNLPLDENPHLRPNSEFYFKSPRQMAHSFACHPQALAATRRIAERCRFELRGGLQTLPVFPTPEGSDTLSYLRELCNAGLQRRFGDASDGVSQQVDYELSVIARVGLANYFLIVWDLVRFAESVGILCQGRGSAANSLVAYALGISPVNPLAHDLVFERFLSDERQLAPDIDIDFQADRREEVIQYAYQRYGTDHAAMACTFVTFRARSAVRDVGKALGLPSELIDRAAKALDTYRSGALAGSEGLQDVLGEAYGVPLVKHLLQVCAEIDGLPRHLGIHNGGMVITGAPITTRLPTEPATMADRTVVQWDKEGLESAGMVKIDILGLRMLSAVSEATRIVEVQTGQRLELERLPFTDRAVYEAITDADTIGVFQVESRAQMTVLPRLKPRAFNDLVVSISLIRLGPVQGNMVHPYLQRRAGAPFTYAHESLAPVLEETLGVILFQEQVLKVARSLAGFSAGQGELLRRALGAKRATEAIDRMHDQFIAGAVGKEVPQETAEKVFESLRAFGGYSFAKSHAAAFATLVYRSAWLKQYHPKAFYVGLLNHQPMGFWQPSIIVNDAKRRGIDVLPPDIHVSAGRCMVEGDAIRIGFNYIKGFGEAVIGRLLAARDARRFASLADLCRRTQLPKRLVEHLILSGTLDGWGRRRELLWQLGKLSYATDELDLDFTDDDVQLAPLTLEEAMLLEHQMLGLSLRQHPIALYREDLKRRGILDSAAVRRCPDGARVRVAGLVVMHQSPPTAHGVHFVTLEDEEGLMDVIFFPDVYARFRRVVRGTALLLVEGLIQQDEGVTNVLAGSAMPFRQ